MCKTVYLIWVRKLDRCCVETKPSYDPVSKILLRWNKHQLLHRITSIKTPLIYNNVSMICMCVYVKYVYFASNKYAPSFLWSFPLVALPILMFCFFCHKVFIHFSFCFHSFFISIHSFLVHMWDFQRSAKKWTKNRIINCTDNKFHIFLSLILDVLKRILSFYCDLPRKIVL